MNTQLYKALSSPRHGTNDSKNDSQRLCRMSVSLSAKLVLAAAQICAMVNLHPYISPVDQVIIRAGRWSHCALSSREPMPMVILHNCRRTWSDAQ
jgi:hypothetical protein